MQEIDVSLGHGTAGLRLQGTGDLMLILHGAGGPEMWEEIAADLARRFSVVLPTHPGFGASGRPEWVETIDDLVLHYASVLDHLEASSVHLVGHSLGGWIAAELAVRDPQRFKSVQLVAPAGIFLPETPIPDNFLWSPEETADHLFFDPVLAQKAKQKVLDPAQEALRYSRLVTVAKLVWNPRWHNPHLAKWLHRISAPTNLIWGEEDRFIPIAYAEAFRNLIPKATLSSIGRCGHVPMVEARSEFQRLLETFVEGILQ